jgi:ABC-type nitrate/sulfonate/bicarbonate transport system substrate-binding protein
MAKGNVLQLACAVAISGLSAAVSPAAAQSAASLNLEGPVNPAFAGVVLAAQTGLFEQEGLRLILKANGADPIESVAAGVDTIGSVRADRFLKAREQGVPIVAFAAGYLENPTVFFALAGAKIRAPQDFVGRRVGYQAGSDSPLVYYALASKLALPRSQIRELEVRDDPEPLLSGQVDVWAGPIGASVYALRQKKTAYQAISPADYGIHLPGTVYFASARTIAEAPSLIRGFLRAIVGGWNKVYPDYKQSAPLIASFAQAAMDPSSLAFALEAQRHFIAPPARRVAEIDLLHWRALDEILVQQKRLSRQVDLSRAITLDFLQDLSRRPITFGK